MKQVARPRLKSHVVDLAKAVRVYNNPKYENDRCLLLFTNPSSVLYLVEHGVPIKSVNIGGMSFHEASIRSRALSRSMIRILPRSRNSTRWALSWRSAK